VLPVFLALALLASWRAGIPNRQDERYGYLVATADVWPEVVTRIPLMCALAPLVIAWGAYSIHPHFDTLVPVTWTRFLVQGSLPLFLLLALALRDLIQGRSDQLTRSNRLARVSQEKFRSEPPRS